MSEEKSPQPIEGSALRAFAGSFASGIVVLTTRDTAGTAYGLTMNAVSSLCVEPPQFLACIAKTAATLGPVLESKVFSLNILAFPTPLPPRVMTNLPTLTPMTVFWACR